jgi:hypothetical protein
LHMEIGKSPASPPKASKPLPKQADNGIEPGGPEPGGDEVVLSSSESEPTSSNLVKPEQGRSYQAHQQLSRPITLSFDDRAIAFFDSAGLQVDLEQAQIVTRDGRRVPLDHRVSSVREPAQRYAVKAGQKLAPDAEPWQFRVPGMPVSVFGKPHGVQVVGADSGFSMKFLDASGNIIDRESPQAGLDDTQGLRVDTQVFRKDRQSTLGRLGSHLPSASEPGPASLPFTDSSITNVNFRAPTKTTLATAKGTFEKLLGSAARERATSIDLKKLEIYEQQFQKRLSKELEAGGEVDGFALMEQTMDDPIARQAMQEIYGPGAETLTGSELLGQVGQKALRACPLEIVVIPRDKSAIDCVEVEMESSKQQLSQAGRAYFLTAHPFAYRAQTGSGGLPTQRLFVGEEILEQEQGVKAVLMHELLHVFEHLYATPQETEKIETSFQQATEFQSLYGSSRDEYLTTVGEEFWGTHGSEGPDWVRENHRPVFELLSKLTDSNSSG